MRSVARPWRCASVRSAAGGSQARPSSALERNGSGWLIGHTPNYPDLSLFQMVEGLRYAFPKAMARLERDVPRVVKLRDAVAGLPRIEAYLASPRRIPFNQQGIFRRYPELDG